MYCSPMDMDSEEVSGDWLTFITFLFFSFLDWFVDETAVDDDDDVEEWGVLDLP